MSPLQPTFWRTSRVLANPVRLRVLQHVCDAGEACVSDTARACDLPLSSATEALRALQARGLLGVRHERSYVIYSPRAEPSVEHAAAALTAMRDAFRRHESPERIIQAMTAYTHARRILIVQALMSGPADTRRLCAMCRISSPALCRHLDKLARRGLVETVDGDVWRLTPQKSPLPRALLAIVRSGNGPLPP